MIVVGADFFCPLLYAGFRRRRKIGEGGFGRHRSAQAAVSGDANVSERLTGGLPLPRHLSLLQRRRGPASGGKLPRRAIVRRCLRCNRLA